MAQDPPTTRVQLHVPEDQQGGVYADRALVWHNQHGFTIDFVAPSTPASTDSEGNSIESVTVVARVRLPVSVIFQVARAIGENVGRYEDKYGKIPAGGPDHPPEEQE